MSSIWAYVALGLFTVVTALALWWQRMQAQADGVAIETAAVNAATAKAQTAIAQAEAAAPTTQASILDRFKAGTA